MPDNEIYQFLKANKLTDKDESTFLNEYSDSTKAKELYGFFEANKLTDKDFNQFYDTYLKKKEVSTDGSKPYFDSRIFNPLAKQEGNQPLPQPRTPVTTKPQGKSEKYLEADWAAPAKASSLREAHEKDLNISGNLWNSFTTGIGRLGATGADITLQILNKVLPSEEGYTDEQRLKKLRGDVVEPTRTATTELIGADVTPEQKQAFGENIVASTAGSLVEMIPAMGGKGLGLLLQAYDHGMESVNSSEEGRKLPENVKTIFSGTVGLVVGAMDRLSLTKIFGKESNKIAVGVATKVLSDLVRKSKTEITAEMAEAAILAELKSLKKTALNSGKKLGSAITVEGVTETGQEGVTMLAEKVLNKSQDKEIFEEKSWKENLSRLAQAGAGGMIGGGMLGTASLPFNRTTNYIAEKIANATSDQDIIALKEEIMASAKDQDLIPSDVQKLSETIDNYIRVNRKVPDTVPNRKDVVDKIVEREEIQAEIEAKKAELEQVDEAFQGEINEDIELLEKRAKDINQELSEPEKLKGEPEQISQPIELNPEVTEPSPVIEKVADIEKRRKQELSEFNKQEAYDKLSEEIKENNTIDDVEFDIEKEINDKYDAEISALPKSETKPVIEKETVVPVSTEQKIADIEKRREDELNAVDKQSGTKMADERWNKGNKKDRKAVEYFIENQDKYFNKPSDETLYDFVNNGFNDLRPEVKDALINKNFEEAKRLTESYEEGINKKYDAEIAALPKSETKPVPVSTVKSGEVNLSTKEGEITPEKMIEVDRNVDRKPTEISKTKEKFKIATPDGTKDVVGQKVLLSGYEGLDLFTHKEDGKNGDFILTEKRTGLEIGRGKTADEATKKAIATLEWQQAYNKDYPTIYNQVNGSIEKRGSLGDEGNYSDIPIPKLSKEQKIKILEDKISETKKEIEDNKNKHSQYGSIYSADFENNFIDRIKKRIEEIKSQTKPIQTEVAEQSKGKGKAAKLQKGEKLIYHHTQSDVSNFNSRPEGTWFTTNEYSPMGARSKGKNIIIKIINVDKLKLATDKDFFPLLKYSEKERAEKLTEQGFDGVKRKVDGDTHYLIFDLDKLQSKEQTTSENKSKSTPIEQKDAIKPPTTEANKPIQPNEPKPKIEGTEKGVQQSSEPVSKGEPTTPTAVLEDGGKKPPIDEVKVPVSGDGKEMIGISHAQFDKVAEELGLPLYEKDPQTIEQWHEQADKRLAKGEMPKLIEQVFGFKYNLPFVVEVETLEDVYPV